jgi:hypothetical protein
MVVSKFFLSGIKLLPVSAVVTFDTPVVSVFVSLFELELQDVINPKASAAAIIGMVFCFIVLFFLDKVHVFLLESNSASRA